MPDVLLRRPDRVRVGPDAADNGNDLILIDAAVSENHTSEYELTRHPVGQGLSIVDHKRLKPRRLTLQCVVTNTPVDSALKQVTSVGLVDTIGTLAASGLGSGLFTNQTSERRDVAVWNKLKEYQAANDLVSIYTTLETYENMQIISVTAPRDSSRGNALHFTMVLEQVRLVNSEETAAIAVQARPGELKQSGKGKKPKPKDSAKANEVAVAQDRKSISARGVDGVVQGARSLIGF